MDESKAFVFHWRAGQPNIKTQCCLTSDLMDEQVLFTHSQRFHHWPGTSPHHSSQFPVAVGDFFFSFPKYSWRIAELPCSPPYLLMTLLSVNRPLNKTTSTLDITANSTYWCQTIVASLLFQWIHEGARSFSTSTFSGGPWLYAEPAEYVRLRFTHKHEKCITGNRGWLHGFSRQKGTEVEPQWVVREEWINHFLSFYLLPTGQPLEGLRVSCILFIFTIFSVW